MKSSTGKSIICKKQAISARERALGHLTVCFGFQSRSERRKGHKIYAQQMVFVSKVLSLTKFK